MQHVQSVSVHIAVLAVGKHAAPTISELATQAGHQIVARATVTDAEPAIRAQLTKWIENPSIDVVIVSGGIASENAAAAIKPLISSALPGFTVEAAQCGMTFVFALPASAGAARAAMETVVLPQLDPNTTPKNLVSSMPRVRNLDTDGIPVQVAKEKTVGGSGLTPRQPSKSSSTPVRHRSLTGANVIRKVDDTSFDPPTREIGLAQLERQIALSANPPHDAETKQVDLSRLPKVPPGADPLSDDTEQIEPGDLPARSSRLSSETIEPPEPATRKFQRTESSAVVPPPAAAPSRGLLPDPPAPRGPIGLRDSGHAPVAPLPSIGPVPSTRTKGPTEPPAHARTKAPTGSVAVPAVIPRSTSADRKPPTQAPPVKRPPTDPPPAPRAAPPRSPTMPPPRPPTGPAAAVKQAEPKQPEPVALPEVAAAVSLPMPERTGPTRPPPSPPPRPPTGPPAVEGLNRGSRATGPSEARDPGPVPTVKQDMGELVSTPLRRSGALPAGTFNYPSRRQGGSKIPLVLAGIAVLAVGFAAVVIVLDRNRASTTPAATKPILAAAPIDAAVPVVALDASVTSEIELEPSAAGSPPEGVKTPPTPTGGRPPRGTPTPKQPVAAGSAAQPNVAAAGSGSGSQAVPDDTVDNAPTNPTPNASDCDEVSCVLAKYDRPCCEKFKPTDSDLKPRTAGGLPAELDKSMVRTGIEKVKPRVVACGEKSSDKGTVKIAVKVLPDGSVKDASVVASPSPALGDCVAAVIKKAEFGKSVGGGSFTSPFVF